MLHAVHLYTQIFKKAQRHRLIGKYRNKDGRKYVMAYRIMFIVCSVLTFLIKATIGRKIHQTLKLLFLPF